MLTDFDTEFSETREKPNRPRAKNTDFDTLSLSVMISAKGICEMKDEKLLYADETYVIRGAAFDVYKEMGNAFDESVYMPA